MRYEETVNLIEDLHVYDHDPYQVLPKLRAASEALLQNDLPKAEVLLQDIHLQLKLQESQEPVSSRKDLRLEWLELYAELFQKYAILALLAFLFMRLNYFRVRMARHTLTWDAATVLTLVVLFLGAAFYLFDLSRYGATALGFFDMQLVLTVIVTVLGGWASGLRAGLVFAHLRGYLHPESWIYAGIILLAATGAMVSSS